MFVLRDSFTRTRCARCRRTLPTEDRPVEPCPACCRVWYCSTECLVKDALEVHRDIECSCLRYDEEEEEEVQEDGVNVFGRFFYRIVARLWRCQQWNEIKQIVKRDRLYTFLNRKDEQAIERWKRRMPLFDQLSYDDTFRLERWDILYSWIRNKIRVDEEYFEIAPNGLLSPSLRRVLVEREEGMVTSIDGRAVVRTPPPVPSDQYLAYMREESQMTRKMGIRTQYLEQLVRQAFGRKCFSSAQRQPPNQTEILTLSNGNLSVENDKYGGFDLVTRAQVEKHEMFGVEQSEAVFHHASPVACVALFWMLCAKNTEKKYHANHRGKDSRSRALQ